MKNVDLRVRISNVEPNPLRWHPNPRMAMTDSLYTQAGRWAATWEGELREPGTLRRMKLWKARRFEGE